MAGNPKGSAWRSTPRTARKSPEARWTIPLEIHEAVKARAGALGEKPSPLVAALRLALRLGDDVLLAELSTTVLLTCVPAV